VPRDGREKTIPLSSLKTTARGFPYYLISGTVLMFRRRLFETEQEVNMAVHYGEGQSDPRWTDSFLFSHRYCGSQVTGYLPTAEYERRVQGEENRLDLVDATAISGGALSPLADRNWLITFLMLAFNLRLGQWLPNPRANAPRGRPRFGTIFRSLLQPADQRPYCFVSDGGHCENMGLVQLLRRRCRLIIVSDAGCDPRHEFADLANALRVARIHGGVQLLVFDPDNSYQDVVRMSDLQLIGNKASGGDKDESAGGNVKAHYVLGRIKYPPRKRQFGDSLRNNGAPAEESEGLDGLLIYIKPSLTGDEDLDVLNYRAAHREFPHEPSNDQWFDDKQVEAYRRLGFHIAENMQQLLRPIIRTSLWEDPQWDNKGGNDLREQFEAGWKEARNPFESGLWMPDGRSELWSDVAMRKR
jgi:hypothetical protein